MTPDELHAILSNLGLPYTGAAKLFGVDDRTVRHWLQGDRSIPETVARVLRMAAAGKLSLEKLAGYATERHDEAPHK